MRLVELLKENKDVDDNGASLHSVIVAHPTVDAKDVAEILKNNTVLKKFGFWQTNIQGDLSIIGGALAENKTLREFEFKFELGKEKNQMRDQVAVVLADGLEKNTSLARLCISSSYIGDVGAAAIASALRQNSSLTDLVLSSNQIRDVGAAAIASALMHNSSLRSLVLSSNQIGDDGVIVIAQALQQNTGLINLTLLNNQIGDRGVIIALAELLRKNTPLTRLNLRKNPIGVEGLKAIADALENNTSLIIFEIDIDTELAAAAPDSIERINGFLERNRMKRAKVIAEELANNSAPSELNLAFDNLNDERAKVIAEGLKQNKSLKKLTVQGDDLTEKGFEAIIHALEENKKALVTELNFDFCKFSSQIDRVNSLLEGNREVASSGYIRMQLLPTTVLSPQDSPAPLLFSKDTATPEVVASENRKHAGSGYIRMQLLPTTALPPQDARASLALSKATAAPEAVASENTLQGDPLKPAETETPKNEEKLKGKQNSPC